MMVPIQFCSIAYSDQFAETMNYFRAMLKTEEKSERALQITSEVIALNAANYTAWYYRRILLQELNKDYNKELEFVSQMAEDNPKNYQIWYHRKSIVEKTGDFSKELEATEKSIAVDSKNYHAWSHRQWVVETNKLWVEELNFIDRLLKEDLRNNSAWNQRYFVITQNGKKTIDKMTREQEIDYSFSWIKKKHQIIKALGFI